MGPPSFSLTTYLLGVDPPAYKAATEAPFLAAAGEGRLDKQTLGKWLANDRLYLHAYIKAVGRTLSVVDLPQTTPEPSAEAAPETRLVDWLFSTLTALRREERLFIHVARMYDLSIDLETMTTSEGGRRVKRVPGTAKLPGLVMFEKLFGSLHPASSVDRNLPLPWLEAAVVFWGTERSYSDAWTWARSKQAGEADAGPGDADGGALRKEFIPNWGNSEFAAFVEQLSGTIDHAVSEAVAVLGDDVKQALVQRSHKVWTELVAAEKAFWPVVG
ncbi:putative transcription regulator [Diaporthe ampelina]|uniref:Putative transcription regulator n=1 Tax=Diaporthe ampelina TaxID=1214573 RepID=A0A0G2FS16_9PEZI|nr:putative transcription regulator [Diaporthe ampelina]